jgi:hypothetical protein
VLLAPGNPTGAARWPYDLIVAAPGDSIGDWLLGGKLGEGGNATVWEASRGSASPVALKVLRTRNAGSEPYRRFVRETETLRSLSHTDGVLPLLESHLPSRPTRRDPAWLAMPIAVPIADALAGKTLDEVVQAMAGVASTLSGLKTTHQLAHRDLKPGNLYRLSDRWLVGDFGLVAIPDVEELTRSGRPLGPLHFTPYEMITDAAHADPHAADVFSFAKTLWVLAVEQRFPPGGHQPVGNSGLSIADFRPHGQAAALDRLVDAATLLRPEDRPTMEQIANDLVIWLELSREPTVLDVSDIRSRLRVKMAVELQEIDAEARKRELGYAAVRRLTEMVAPFNAALLEIHPLAQIDTIGDRLSENQVLSLRHMGSPTFLLRWQRCSMIGGRDPHRRYVLRLSRGLELEEGGKLAVRFMVDVGLDGLMHTDFSWVSAPYEAPVDSVALERAFEQAIADLSERFEEGLRVFEEKMPH